MLAATTGIAAYAVPRGKQRDYLGTDYYHGGAVRMDIGGLHPAKLHAGMLRLARAAGVISIMAVRGYAFATLYPRWPWKCAGVSPARGSSGSYRR